MFEFHENLYTDVRIEEVFETRIVFTLGSLDESKIRKYKAAFIRVFDGDRWFYASTSDVNNIQKEIDKLSIMAGQNININENPIVRKFQVNKGEFISFKEFSITDIRKDDKAKLLEEFFSTLNSYSSIKMWKANYMDNKKVCQFYSSKGSKLIYDTQRAGFSISMNFSSGDKKLNERFSKGSAFYNELLDQKYNLKEYIEKCEDFLVNSKPAAPGKYTVILSPEAAGVFAHESFGHKSEADFMVGDETMKREWAIGTKIGPEILSIVDSGMETGGGFVPFDDEGTAATKTYLIKDGKLSGRLHSASTAAVLEELVTGNARAINYEFEPIVRMSTTYILPGNKTEDELFSEVQDGFYIDTIKHGSGMSTFTIAPSLAYRIKNGKIIEPVNISVLTGSVFETLSLIDGLSDKLKLLTFVMGGCGKMEQYPLSVGFGGPYVRINGMNIQ